MLLAFIGSRDAPAMIQQKKIYNNKLVSADVVWILSRLSSLFGNHHK